jgi:hypothetical protein
MAFKRQRFHYHLFWALLLCALGGCLNPEKRISREFPKVQGQWQTNVALHTHLQVHSLGWAEAVAMMEEYNLKLRHLRNDITNNHENVRQVFKDLLPTLDLRAGVSRSLKTLGMTGIDDVTFDIDGFINVPGIVNMNARLFAARLGLIRAQTAYRLATREQMLELYKIFLDAQEHRETVSQLKVESSFAQSVRNLDPVTGEGMIREVNSKTLSLEKEAEAQQSHISDILGTRDFLWDLQTNGVPNFTYDNNPLPLSDTNRIAQLQMRMVAIELVGSWATINGIKLQYWPELNIFITGPPVFQHSGGVNQVWRAEDISVRGDLFWRLDTRGYISRQLRQTRREQNLAMAQVQQDSLMLIEKVVAAQRLIAVQKQQLEQVRQILTLLEKTPMPQDFLGITNMLELYRSLHDQERRLRRDLAELNSLLWFVDEQRWRELESARF